MDERDGNRGLRHCERMKTQLSRLCRNIRKMPEQSYQHRTRHRQRVEDCAAKLMDMLAEYHGDTDE